jgi:zinc protease
MQLLDVAVVLVTFGGPAMAEPQAALEPVAEAAGEVVEEQQLESSDVEQGVPVQDEVEESTPSVSVTPPRWNIETYDDDPLGVRRVVLDNGLTVLLSENHERPEVFGAVVVRTGGKNDPPDNTGMAHYLEHMLFKGTTTLGTTDWERERPLQERLETLYEQRRSATGDARKRIDEEIGQTVAQTYAFTVPNEIDQLLETIGATGVNAFTSYDETVYHNTFPSSQMQTWLAIYAQRFQDPVFRLFPTELEAVYEEKNIAIDTTGYELFRTFMRHAFPNHPYGTNDILGEVEHLKNPSLKAMKAYYERWYVPGNMALVLSGAFDIDEVLPMIDEHFGAWARGPDPVAELRPLPPFERDQRVSARATPVRVGAIAYRTVPESHPDYAALQLARRLLSNEQRSGLIDRISDGGKVLYAVHVPADLADHNLDVIAYVPRILTQSFRAAERLMTEPFRQIAKGAFDAAQFEALKEGLLVEERARWESNEERALAIGHAFVAHDGWKGHLDYLARLETLTKADVLRVANELFADRRLIMRSRAGLPKKARLDKPEHPPVEPRKGAHSELFEALRTMPTGEPRIEFVDFSDVQTVQVQDGVPLRVNGNPFNDLYQLELRFGVGSDAIRELDVLEDYIARIGSEQTPGPRMRERLFALSTTLEADAEIDRFVVRLSGPQAHMSAALTLLAELMEEPRAERKPLRQVRREIWAFRRLDRKNPPSVGSALREHVLYRDDSRYHREYGPSGARFLGTRRLMKAWDRVQGHALEIGYVGNETPEAVASMLRERLPLRKNPTPAVPHLVYARQLPATTTVYFVPQRGAVQTQLWFALEGTPLEVETRPAADAFASYFGGGMAGLVFQEIREFRALAYSARAWYARDEEVVQRGHLVAHVGCQVDKTFEAIDVMVDLITKMPEREDRMDLVRSSLVRGQETESPSFRDLQDKIDSWTFTGEQEDPRRRTQKAYGELTFDDISSFYRDHVAGKPLAIMVVADPRKVKPRDLRKYGKVVRLRKGQLYSR